MIRNVSCAANQYIRMISEGSCDTEDWSNDAENSALITAINYIFNYIKIENVILKFYFWSNKNSVAKHKRHVTRKIKLLLLVQIVEQTA